MDFNAAMLNSKSLLKSVHLAIFTLNVVLPVLPFSLAVTITSHSPAILNSLVPEY